MKQWLKELFCWHHWTWVSTGSMYVLYKCENCAQRKLITMGD